MRPKVKKRYRQIPRNQKTVQSKAEKLKSLGIIRPEIKKRYIRARVADKVVQPDVQKLSSSLARY